MPSNDQSAALPPHDHTIEPGEINRRGCARCEIDRERSAAQDRFTVLREKAERRGRIKHPEGDRYETPDWLDVLVLLDEIDRLREQVNSGRAGREALEGLPEGTLPRV